MVQVDNLYVNYVWYYPGDGDWNIMVSDSNVKLLTTELIPRDQAASSNCPSCTGNLTVPPALGRITEVGYPYCDQGDPLKTPCEAPCWPGHGPTCWEIHPVVNWFPYGPIPELPSMAPVLFTVLILVTLIVKKHYPSIRSR